MTLERDKPLLSVVGFNLLTLFVFITAPVAWQTENFFAVCVFVLFCQVMVVLGFGLGEYGGRVAPIAKPPFFEADGLMRLLFSVYALTFPVFYAYRLEFAPFVIKRTYAEPHWSSRQAAVLASETVSLFGVPIVAGRKVPYARVNPVEAREIFLRSALVEGQWRTRHHFFEDNQQLRAEAAELEERTRRRDLVVDDQVIYEATAQPPRPCPPPPAWRRFCPRPSPPFCGSRSACPRPSK